MFSVSYFAKASSDRQVFRLRQGFVGQTGFRIGCFVAMLALTPVLGVAQEAVEEDAASGDLTKDELLNLLEIRKSQLEMEQGKAERDRAKTEYEETKKLYAEKIVTSDEVDKAQQDYERSVLKYKQAKIDLEKTRLEFLKGATLVTVVDAKKYRGEEGQVMVSVKLRNDSDIDKARVAMGGEADVSREKLESLLKIDNVIVSLRDEAIIGDPYQRIIPELKYGEEATLEYRLLKRDVEVITVAAEFLQEEKQYTVFLKKEALQDLPMITSTQYAQQGQLGTKIRYDLELERLSKTEQSFSLAVLNLPPQISFAFLDPGSGAQITQVKFSSEISKQSLDLEVSIPEKLKENLVGMNISFYVLITKQAQMKSIYELTRKYEGEEVPAEEVVKLKGNKVNLILIPQGVPKVELVVANLFKEVVQGEEMELKFSVVNSGTLVLRSVASEVDPPLEWEVELEPREIEVIEPGEKVLVTAKVRPPEGVPIGEYIMVLKCEGHSGVETVEALEKDFKVRIAAKGNITSTLVLVFVLVGLVLFIAIASVKISRR